MSLSKIKAFRPSKTAIVLAAAIGIGLVAALGARSYLTGRVADLEARSRGRNVAVVVAQTDLLKGARLSSSSVAVRNIPMEFAHSSAISPENFERADGQALAFNVKAGEMILWGLLEPRKPPTFSARLEAGRRAITVPVDEINSISGLLEPGDLIDLIVTLDQDGKKVTVPLMQTVQVLATGQRAVDDPKSGERKIYSTVTLDTDPKQAQNVIAARETGRITALLRNPQDKTHFASAAPANVVNRQAQEVPVLYGGRSAKFPSEGLNLRPEAEKSLQASPLPLPAASNP